jgi:hypothetical protein
MAKKTSTSSSTKNAGSGAQFEAGVAKLMTLAVQMGQQVRAMNLTSLTPEERMHTMGKLRDGEADAMNAVYDTMDKFPGVFWALATKDGGTNANVVETAPARASLASAQDLGPVLSALEALTTHVSDHVIASANAAKEVSVPAYAIGRTSAKQDPAIRTSLSKALEFYGMPNRIKTGRVVRAAKKQAKAAKKAKSAGT